MVADLFCRSDLNFAVLLLPAAVGVPTLPKLPGARVAALRGSCLRQSCLMQPPLVLPPPRPCWWTPSNA